MRDNGCQIVVKNPFARPYFPGRVAFCVGNPLKTPMREAVTDHISPSLQHGFFGPSFGRGVSAFWPLGSQARKICAVHLYTQGCVRTQLRNWESQKLGWQDNGNDR